MPPRYLIGIDLGTTNSALAYVDLKASRGARPQLQAFAVPQLVAAGETAPRALLPSFLYLPGPHDLPPGATALPWDRGAADLVGEFARDHGAKIPGRLVSSAKSWLCHPGVDRTAALLPWGAPPDVLRVSPLAAATRFLKHLVDAWNHVNAQTPDDRLENLPAVLAVPASFDDVARTLTLEAARQAGLTNVTVLEEPQAAFYCWQHLAEPAELARMHAGMSCLVVDVGGGTTDFSLIAAIEEQGELRFIREAVGDHLLLGGDNMDLALARYVETKIPHGRLDATQFASLVQACRRAKEVLLGPDPPPRQPVTVVGRGRSVVGGAVSVPLTTDDIRSTLFDGFFPPVRPGDSPQRAARGALHEMGLPYVADPAVTRHLGAFLERHLPPDRAPDAVLFNGGVFQPASVRARLLDAIRPWYAAAGQAPPVTLVTPSLDLAVAYGAAAYGWIRHTGGRVIGGGTARSYYVEIGQDARPDKRIPVLCVVPRHLGENDEVAIAKPELELALGEPVLFPLFTSTVRDDKPGQLLDVAPEQLRRLPPLQTVLRGGKRAGAGPKTVPVTLAARTTAIGTLELSCVASTGGGRWRLEFNTRDTVDDDEPDDASPAGGPTEVVPDAVVRPGEEVLRAAYTDTTGPPPGELTKALEAAFEMPRDDWPTGLCRRLWETLADVAEARRKSPGYLARWYNLSGFVLRPGFGDALDRFRVDTLWKLLHTPKPGGPPPPEPSGADAWIMWRRTAGGLTTALQNTLFDRLRPALLPAKGKVAFKPGANEYGEMWRAAAALERLDVRHKQALGEALLRQVRPQGAPHYAFWSLGRLGARQLLYGPLNAVLHPETVSAWVESLLTFTPTHDSERLAWAFCLAQLTRRSGQRALDVDDPHRDRVLDVLRNNSVPAAWIDLMQAAGGRGASEQAMVFGDSLPVGLRLRG
jgi:hypothetical protein